MSSSPDTHSLPQATTARGGRASSALLKLQADERLVAHVRRGNEAAFEVLVSRYRTRLLAFCRHMLGAGARRDAEDVLQEVFTSAYRAMLGDTRPINVRPWLYRIARNRCLNHLRRDPMPSIEGMELTVVDERIGTAETVHQRAEVRQLLSDIQNLPETQRTAILLREIDDLSYEQIAMAMDNTVAAVKSLLVRARVGLAEAAESRRLSCDEVRFELGQHAEGLVDKLTPPTRRHLKDCSSCAAFQQDLKDTNKALAMLAPAFGLVVLFKSVLGGAGHAGTAGAGAGAAGAATAAGGGIISIGGVLSAKTMTGLAAAIAVTGAAVEVKHVAAPPRPAAVAEAPVASRVTPRQPVAAASASSPTGGVSVVAGSTPTEKTDDRADQRDRAKATTPKADDTTATTPESTTPDVTTPTTPAAAPGTSPSTPGATIEARTGTAQLPDLEDRSDSTTVHLSTPRPTRPTTVFPTTTSPAAPASSPPATSAPTPQSTPAPTATPESTPAPSPEPTATSPTTP